MMPDPPEDDELHAALNDDAFWVDGVCVVCQSVMEEERQHTDDCRADELIRQLERQAVILAEQQTACRRADEDSAAEEARSAEQEAALAEKDARIGELEQSKDFLATQHADFRDRISYLEAALAVAHEVLQHVGAPGALKYCRAFDGGVAVPGLMMTARTVRRAAEALSAPALQRAAKLDRLRWNFVTAAAAYIDASIGPSGTFYGPPGIEPAIAALAALRAAEQEEG